MRLSDAYCFINSLAGANFSLTDRGIITCKLLGIFWKLLACRCILTRSNQWQCLMPFLYILLFASVDMVYPLWCITCLSSIWTLKNSCLTFHSYSGEWYRAIMALMCFCLTFTVISYGHGRTVSYPNLTFSGQAYTHSVVNQCPFFRH